MQAKKVVDIKPSILKKYDLIFLDLDNTLVKPETKIFYSGVLE
jgi:predicted HAD superfamily phosphohydrolase YqeG